MQVSAAPLRTRLVARFAFAGLTFWVVELLAVRGISLAVMLPRRKCKRNVVSSIRLIVNWNFCHLVNVRHEAGFNAVNPLQDYAPLSFANPREIIHGDTDDEF